MKDTANQKYYSHIEAPTVKAEDLKSNADMIPPRNGEHLMTEEDYASDLYEMYTGYSLESPIVDQDMAVQGKVTAMDSEKLTLDIGYKFPIYVLASREHYTKDILADYNIGDPIEVYVNELIKTGRYTIGAYGSVSELETVETRDDMIDSISKNGENKFYKAEIKELVEGGYLVDIKGVTAFLPGSLAAANKINDFKEKLGDEIMVAPISQSDGRRYMVVSHKEYIKQVIPDLIDDIVLNEKIYTGTVTGATNFGVFVEFMDYLTGMIHVSELDEKAKKLHEDRLLEPGVEIEFRVKEVASADRIILTRKDPSDDPWNDFHITIPSTVNTEVKGIKNYGLFLEIEGHPGIVGLLHVSEMRGMDPHTFDRGDEVEVVVSKVDPHAKKVYYELP